MKKLIVLVVFVTLFFLLPLFANAGSIGVYCWQMAEYDDIFCFDVDNKGFVYELTGSDHLTGDYKVPTDGSALLDPYSNVIRMEFTTTFMGTSLEVSTSIDPSSLDGTYEVDDGRSGDFLFLGTGPLSTSERLKSNVTIWDKK